MSEVRKYRMKPVIKEAIRLTEDNAQEIWDWAQENGGSVVIEWGGAALTSMRIQTHMGDMEAHPGDWVVRGLEGEFYPVQDSKFQATYEEVQ